MEDLYESNDSKQDILLETGTNEVEVLEFMLEKQRFGINVAKIMQIISYDEKLVTAMPDSDSSMLGVFLWREKTIPFFDLGLSLHQGSVKIGERSIVLVTEFNGNTYAFLVEGVNRIHRISWDAIQPVSTVLSRYSARITGTVHVEQNEILLIDFEHIIAEMCPETRVGYKDSDLITKPRIADRENVKIILAEDSGFIRKMITQILNAVGYTAVTTFENGEAAYQEILRRKQEAEKTGAGLETVLNLVVTDIEMPRLDGLTLCKRVKQDLHLELPVIVFSSLINAQMADKCSEVGADAHITKPEVGQLVGIVDSLCLKGAQPISN